jgi:hypothetical protein
MEIIFQKKWDYTFSKKDNNEFILSVLCGTIALFEFEIILNQSEIDQHNKKGKEFIEYLVQKIRDKPDDWISRKIN